MNGCFQAYPLSNVLNFLLSNYKLLNTLAHDLGCFPLDVSPSRDYVWLGVYIKLHLEFLKTLRNLLLQCSKITLP
jgi:hypothetical protein